MRNLKCVHQSQHAVDTTLPCTASSWDTVNDAVLFAVGPSSENPVIELRRTHSIFLNDKSSTVVASWDAPSPLPDLPVDRILSLQYLVASETTCLVLAGGDIVIVRDDPLEGQEKIEIVGSVDAGISAASWCPDQDLLAVVTRVNTLLLMTADFDNVGSATFSLDDAKLSKQVNVGWGKAETQFKGKGAKALQDPTMPSRFEEGALSPHDDNGIKITWRGDSAYVAISTIEEQKRRMFRVFSRDGVLDSVTESVDGLEGALSWKPSGQLIAAIQRSSTKLQVVFFERNGLRHGEFSLRLDDNLSDEWVSSISLAWNVDSSVLAVSFCDRVQFWTMGNYHYYLKYELLLYDKQAFSPPVTWHPEDPGRCLVHEARSNASAQIRSLRFTPAISHGPTSSPHDLGYTVVIDGKVLRITPLKAANVPPPMALHEVQLASNALDAAVNATNSRVAVLHASSLTLLESTQKDDTWPEPVVSNSFALPTGNSVTPLQVAFMSSDEALVLISDQKASKVKVFRPKTATWVFEAPLTGMSSLTRPIDSQAILVLNDTTTTKLEISTADAQPTNTSALCTFPSSVSRFEGIQRAAEFLVFGLTPSGMLYANDREMMRNCTSFMLTDSYLITTTATHMLKFIILGSREAAHLEAPPDQPESDELCRSIERGAKLVAAIPSTFAVVLQMPRGNLETIYPRALVLSGIRQNIDSKQYKKAFMACRNHRVDMNILHDHAPTQFFNCAELFIDQLKKVEHIDLFLSQLTEHDVTQTLYRDPSATAVIDAISINAEDQEAFKTGRTAPSVPENPPLSSKVNRICEAFIAVLKHRITTNLQNLVTANLCKSPPDIEAGLNLILGLQTTNPDLVEDAMEHICFLADVNKIYEAALGIYNLDLALLVAQQSQKDPREYLPYLQALQELAEGRRRFQIDDDLSRHTKALQHLYDLGDIEEVMTYTERHELYKHALALSRYNKSHHDKLMRSYAMFLDNRNRYREAAVAFESLHDYHAASDAYRAISLWRESLSSAMLATPSISPTDLDSLASSLADALEESKDYASAAQIRLDYLHNVETAIRTFCKGNHFGEASRTAALHGKPHLIPELIDPGLGEGFAALSEMLADCRGQLNAQIPRLRELRKKRDADPLAFLEGGAATGESGDVPDDLSLAGSTTSTHASTLLTRYTARTANTLATGASRRTSKNARREERKRARGKKGSVYEEEYLVNSVGRLIDRINSTSGEVERTVDALCRRSMWERAEALEAAMKEVVGMCDACVPEVWEVKEEVVAAHSADAKGGETAQARGGDRVFLESIDEAKRARTAPVVKPYAGSALLGRQ